MKESFMPNEISPGGGTGSNLSGAEMSARGAPSGPEPEAVADEPMGDELPSLPGMTPDLQPGGRQVQPPERTSTEQEHAERELTGREPSTPIEFAGARLIQVAEESSSEQVKYLAEAMKVLERPKGEVDREELLHSLAMIRQVPEVNDWIEPILIDRGYTDDSERKKLLEEAAGVELPENLRLRSVEETYARGLEEAAARRMPEIAEALKSDDLEKRGLALSEANELLEKMGPVMEKAMKGTIMTVGILFIAYVFFLRMAANGLGGGGKGH
jgi:hypothetical protein